MRQRSFSARYTAEIVQCGGRCPIEAGVLGRLNDHECRHGRPVRPHASVRLLAAGGRRRARAPALAPGAHPRKARRLNPRKQPRGHSAMVRTTVTRAARAARVRPACTCDAGDQRYERHPERTGSGARRARAPQSRPNATLVNENPMRDIATVTLSGTNSATCLLREGGRPSPGHHHHHHPPALRR